MAFIDVEKFKEAVIAMSSSICSNWETAGILNLINAQPTGDVKEVVRGKWVLKNEGTYNVLRTYCSECGLHSGIGGIRKNQLKPFCPNCGADMREAE